MAEQPKKYYVISTPYTHFTGVREGVSFHLGEARTEDEEVVSRLRDLGYRVRTVWDFPDPTEVPKSKDPSVEPIPHAHQIASVSMNASSTSETKPPATTHDVGQIAVNSSGQPDLTGKHGELVVGVDVGHPSGDRAVESVAVAPAAVTVRQDTAEKKPKR